MMHHMTLIMTHVVRSCRYCGNDSVEVPAGPIGTLASPARAPGAPPTNAAAPAGSTTYREYERSVCLQMVGRAGRPQFDTEGVAVIMTQQNTAGRYQNLLLGAEEVESCLGHSFAEHLNAEIVLKTVKTLDQAVEWLQTTFMYIRVGPEPRVMKPPCKGTGSIGSSQATLPPLHACCCVHR